MWLAGTNRHDCKTCKDINQDYIDEGFDPVYDCATCFPEPHPFNRAAYILYTDCANQLILGFGGAVALSMPSVDIVMDCYDVDKDERLELHREVQLLAGIVLSHQQKAAENKAKNKKGK